ncbi:anhydro-N-acetylmuramic acid kinase [Achromobacter insolitus]|uniref:Anhydro-N-acetylmuramic acid kinase n=2 Tax=Achromobacter insolitus TaxID=217204 RepID=A0A6S7F6J1_9BURK|nr:MULTISPECIES: anhydro-N-acetylmuramic acid kinase [Achromobacter]APX77323.1 anhydro-N-acetylmuramic acid kinase [Achromobacter insolitus]AXA73183.1 anhydro-N-acetylmuramic acid kinase [Achromobacter insolitus]MDH3066792.1 anhydro-N-acetylmuramic acid kinase [Achromobacter insolitus]MDH3066798.1 anhydro-N-acetylmuramic acid kinase [Achromobacter insolitus]MEB3099385.1 anhydro-N-acetylmuramic acid kinase [Achromobacter sp. D10]
MNSSPPSQHQDTQLYIGLMSGTSVDGVDGVLVRLGDGQPPAVQASASLPMPADLRRELLALNQSGDDELARAALAANSLARLYAQAVAALLQHAGVAAGDVAAIGAHGQTVRHRPDLGYTVQLNAPALLAELTGIDVVADFRSRDVAAGGQGAPLVPPFHAAIFGAPQGRAVLNLGGIANVTLLEPGHAPRGFDTGPANVLLDGWCQRHLGQAYDADGRWAATGQVLAPLLEQLISSEPWFALPPPKSTGRDLFNMQWLDERLAAFDGPKPAPQDVQATLQRLTARTVANAIDAAAASTQEVFVCGGGARNTGLMRELAYCLQRPVRPTDALGVPAQEVEALAFAWLAQAFMQRRPAGLPAVTGARGPRILGALYPA